MVCLRFEPGAAGWKAQTNPLSYCGTSNIQNCLLDKFFGSVSVSIWVYWNAFIAAASVSFCIFWHSTTDFLKRLSMRPWWWSSGQRDFTQTISVRIPLKLYRFFCNIVVETSENEKRGRVGPFFKKAAFDIQLLYLFLKWDSGLWQLIKRLKHVKKKIAQKIIFDNCFFWVEFL